MSNAPIIGGTHGVVVGIDGCRWWAENGLICWERPDNSYGTISVKDALERLRGINDLVGDRQFGKGFHTPSEVKETQNYIDRMLEICKQAKIQGTPDDSSAVRDHIRRRRKSVVIPRKLSSF